MVQVGQHYTDNNGITDIVVLYVNKGWAGVSVSGIGDTTRFVEVRVSSFNKLKKIGVSK